MIVDRLFKKHATSAIAVIASVAFVVGSIYMYQIPLATVSGYLFYLLVLLIFLLLAAGVLSVVFILARKLLSNRDD